MAATIGRDARVSGDRSRRVVLGCGRTAQDSCGPAAHIERAYGTHEKITASATLLPHDDRRGSLLKCNIQFRVYLKFSGAHPCLLAHACRCRRSWIILRPVTTLTIFSKASPAFSAIKSFLFSSWRRIASLKRLR